MMALARLGGFIALFNLIILFVRYLHRKHFERNLNIKDSETMRSKESQKKVSISPFQAKGKL